MSATSLLESSLKSLPFLHRGKVRDIYAVGDDKLLVIQTDRLSAFDVVMPHVVRPVVGENAHPVVRPSSLMGVVKSSAVAAVFDGGRMSWSPFTRLNPPDTGP